MVEELGKPYTAGGSVLEAWCRTMDSNQSIDYFVEPMSSKSDIKSVVELVSISRSSQDQCVLLDGGGEGLVTYLHNYKRRKAFRNRLSSHTTRRPDLGASRFVWNPIVLRPVFDHHYEVVGRAYVHGLGNAEGILGPLSRRLTAEKA